MFDGNESAREDIAEAKKNGQKFRPSDLYARILARSGEDGLQILADVYKSTTHNRVDLDYQSMCACLLRSAGESPAVQKPFQDATASGSLRSPGRLL